MAINLFPLRYILFLLSANRLFMSAENYPDDVINQALRKQGQSTGQRAKSFDLDDYVLKIVGREEYLLPDENMCRPLYKYTVS